MFYIKCPKGRMQVDHSRIGITRENVFALCRVCGREVKIDIEEYTLFHQMRIDTRIECEECRQRKLSAADKAKDETGFWTPADFSEAYDIQIGYVSPFRSRPDPRSLDINRPNATATHGGARVNKSNPSASADRKYAFKAHRFAAKKEDLHERE